MENIRKSAGDSQWFTESRFGLFIHWGLYSLGARHEWIMDRERITVEKYKDKYFTHFDPDLYDPEFWAKTAKDAGMKYFVITTKHHEGFCLWDSKWTNYKATKSPAGRDLLRPMIEAFRKEGLRIGLYHSLADWEHPHYVIDKYNGPYRDSPEKDEMNKSRNQANYAQYLHRQIEELLTEFGKIDILFMDLSTKSEYRKDGKGKEDWQSEKLYKIIRKLQPGIMLNDRLDLAEDWDIKTPEQVLPREWMKVAGQPVVWEACQTFSGSWGYYRDEALWRSADEIIRTLIDCVSKGGNLLLNVGPTARGEFDARAMKRLESIGKWMKRHNRSIYGCTKAPDEFKVPENCKLTYNPKTKRLYVHILAWPYKHLYLDGKAYQDRVEYVQLLNDASEIIIKTGASPHLGVATTSQSPGIQLTLPICKPDVAIPTLEIFLK